MFWNFAWRAVPENELVGVARACFRPQRSGDAPSKPADGPGRADPRFGDQDVDVFGHDHVAHQRELILLAYGVYDFQKRVAFASGTQERVPPVATASNKMQIRWP